MSMAHVMLRITLMWYISRLLGMHSGIAYVASVCDTLGYIIGVTKTNKQPKIVKVSWFWEGEIFEF